jgi:Fe2+ transport system protein FeoA
LFRLNQNSQMFPLNTSKVGENISIQCFGCSTEDACRLRELGCVEGASAKLVSKQHHLILQVGETRLAINGELASKIFVLPLI